MAGHKARLRFARGNPLVMGATVGANRRRSDMGRGAGFNQWSVVSGQWSVVSGQWSVDSGQWSGRSQMRLQGRTILLVMAFGVGLLPGAQAQTYSRSSGADATDMRAAAQRVFALANEARAQAGVRPLQWDPALTAAAMAHCRRMAQEGPIAHRYGGEPDLSERAAQAGAHFSVIEENVAIGPTADAIHEEWMQSPGHRQNLLSPEIDRVGVAIVPARGVLYAVADYSRGVEQMSAPQVEARVAELLRPSAVTILRDPSAARAACATDEGMPRAEGGMQPRFIMRWQDADLSQLPQELADRLATGRFRAADVGSCPAQDAGGAFTAYRIAVILY
jgi:hypothetical protein